MSPTTTRAKRRAGVLPPTTPEALRRAALAQRKLARGSSSPFRGVTRNGAKFCATARVNHVTAQVSGFETAEEAALGYDGLLLGLGGDRAKLNFPEVETPPITAQRLREQVQSNRKSRQSSQFVGVSLGPDGRFHAEINGDGRHHRCGEWRDEIAAAEAYDRASLFFRGTSGRRNFPGRPLVAASPAELRAESRACTKAERTSRYHGVVWVNASDGYGGWRAEIRRGGRLHTIGRYDDERDAAIAYDRVLRGFGEDATLNFPHESWPAASLAEIRRENRARYKETKTSRFHGVSWAKHKGAWLASIVVDYVYYFLGYHEVEEDAAHACDRKRRELGCVGPYNFPRKGDQA